MRFFIFLILLLPFVLAVENVGQLSIGIRDSYNYYETINLRFNSTQNYSSFNTSFNLTINFYGNTNNTGYLNVTYNDSNPVAFIPDGTLGIGKFYSIYTGVNFTSAELVFEYTDEDLVGVSESSLQIYMLSNGDTEWEALSTTINTVLRTLTATAPHFSSFGVFGSSASAGSSSGSPASKAAGAPEVKPKTSEISQPAPQPETPQFLTNFAPGLEDKKFELELPQAPRLQKALNYKVPISAVYEVPIYVAFSIVVLIFISFWLVKLAFVVKK